MKRQEKVALMKKNEKLKNDLDFHIKQRNHATQIGNELREKQYHADKFIIAAKQEKEMAESIIKEYDNEVKRLKEENKHKDNMIQALEDSKLGWMEHYDRARQKNAEYEKYVKQLKTHNLIAMAVYVAALTFIIFF